MAQKNQLTLFRLYFSIYTLVMLQMIIIQWMQTEHPQHSNHSQSDKIRLTQRQQTDFSDILSPSSPNSSMQAVFIRTASSLLVVDDLFRWKVLGDESFVMYQFSSPDVNLRTTTSSTIPCITRKVRFSTLQKGNPLSNPFEADRPFPDNTFIPIIPDPGDEIEIGFMTREDQYSPDLPVIP